MSKPVEIGLTGNKRYRTGLFGKVILQVEYQHQYFDDMLTSPIFTHWRDARVEDLK